MNDVRILPLRDVPERLDEAASWFHDKWKIPLNAYLDSMRDCLSDRSRIPQWYLALSPGGVILGGAGLIENDFHPRKDLSPNLCALYVEESARGQGIAGSLLRFIRLDALHLGHTRLYLLTDHNGFYERYGWRYLCGIRGDFGDDSRVYEIGD